MNRLAVLAAIVAVLAALSACHERDGWHWITPIPPVTIEPHVAPPTPTVSLLPTITPDGR